MLTARRDKGGSSSGSDCGCSSTGDDGDGSAVNHDGVPTQLVDTSPPDLCGNGNGKDRAAEVRWMRHMIYRYMAAGFGITASGSESCVMV